MLSPHNVSLVRNILREHNREEVLKAHGLRASDRLLLCGPSRLRQDVYRRGHRRRAWQATRDGAQRQRGLRFPR